MENKDLQIFRNESDNLIKSGENILNENKFFGFIDYIMNDPVSKQFVNEHFSDWDSVKTSIMFIKTYEIVQNQLKNFECDESDKRKLAITLVKKLIDNSESRKEIIKNMYSFMGQNWDKCEKICSEITKS